MKKLHYRLTWDKIIRNLADPARPPITRTVSDQNVIDLLTRIGEALEELAKLDRSDANDVDSARSVWDWIFKSDGFFAEFDRKRKEDEKAKSLLVKAALVGHGAHTSPLGTLGSLGVANLGHSFHGGDKMD